MDLKEVPNPPGDVEEGGGKVLEEDIAVAVPEKVRESIISQIPAGRLGEPEEIARCVAFLASDDAGFVNGSTISANGAQFFV